MSRTETRHAAFGAACVGVLLALVSCLTGALPSGAAPHPGVRTSSAPSFEVAPAQAGLAAVRTAQASLATAAGLDRTSGAHGSPIALAGALLVLAALCLAAAVRRSRAWRVAVRGDAHGCRAPPAPAVA